MTASEPAPADTDEVLARELDLVERTHVEPSRVDPARMLEGAPRGARRACPDLRLVSRDGLRRVEGPPT